MFASCWNRRLMALTWKVPADFLLQRWFNKYIWATAQKTNTMACAPSKDSDQPVHPPSLTRIFAVPQWVAKDPSFLHADSEDSDQTGWMPRLIWVFAERTVILLVLSCGGSNIYILPWHVYSEKIGVTLQFNNQKGYDIVRLGKSKHTII